MASSMLHLLPLHLPTYVRLMNCISNVTDDSDDAWWVYPNSVVAMVLHNICNMCSCDLPDVLMRTYQANHTCPCYIYNIRYVKWRITQRCHNMAFTVVNGLN